MAQPHPISRGSFEPEHLRRYLPPDLADVVAGESPDPDSLAAYMVEAFVHLAAARYTIATYLPRLLVYQLLDERLESPWLRWVEGSLLFADLSGSTALAERLPLEWDVIAGISAPQLLSARHRIVLHGVGQPVHVTTARRRRPVMVAVDLLLPSPSHLARQARLAPAHHLAPSPGLITSR